MSRFFIGQRVRIVGADGYPGTSVVGMDAVVNELGCRDHFGCGGMVGITVAGEDDWCFHPHQIEPILPEGHRAGDYSNVRDLMDALSQGVSA